MRVVGVVGYLFLFWGIVLFFVGFWGGLGWFGWVLLGFGLVQP